MSPHVLFVGAENAGSWQVRGVQMAGALGARATLRPTSDEWRWADVAVLVKRAIHAYGSVAAQTRLPIIWDAVDYWTQPDENASSLAWHIERTQRLQQEHRIATVIAATKQMADDVGGVYVPHHVRPGLAPTPIRPEAKVVAYEGMPKYLGPWRKDLEYACARLGLVFSINPTSLSDADIVVAFRGEKWTGEACERWKSGVKYVNAIAAGRPVLTNHCSAAHEIKPFGTIVDHPDHVLSALRALMPARTRQLCYEVSLKRAPEFSLATIADQYRGVLERVAGKVAA